MRRDSAQKSLRRTDKWWQVANDRVEPKGEGRSTMIRHGLKGLALACGLMAGASFGQAHAQALTVPPDLRTPSEAAPPEPTEGGKARSAKPKREKRAAQTKPRAANAPKSPSSQPEGRRLYPPDIDRGDGGESRVKPSFTPGGNLGIGGRF